MNILSDPFQCEWPRLSNCNDVSQSLLYPPSSVAGDTMVLASSRRRRRDFLVSALPAAVLLGSSSNLA